MNNFFTFLTDHWALVSLFIVALIWLIIEEAIHQGLGGSRQTPQGVTHLINREHAVVVDLREANAFRDGHIANSINIPYARLEQSMDKLLKHKDNSVILICAMGNQSTQAMHKLKKQGMTKLYILGGGLSAWKKAGYPLKKQS